MNRLTIVAAYDAATVDCHPLRLERGAALPVGSVTYLDELNPSVECLVIDSVPYVTAAGDRVDLAVVSRGEPNPEPELPLHDPALAAFTLILDERGEVAAESFNELDEPPQLGVFVEYQPGTTNVLPPRRVIARYERFKPDHPAPPFPVLYLAQLDLITVPVLSRA